ncbi:malto-oligosyltrehalose synthase [Plantibacter sp. VKM Ac-2880]|uniref:malto-oligosyltrehalose synthase n=1 Tax=Plantibacter sp. VKM Ac-2880 TaxID=2783827 RepID=UPI00188F3E01|nr:malto-oligosyltrehalose synthase [Plantibacter sp. VKM Ac-2880]MBF4570343.1 malto-oligosyltrehalose synthase [Plantibacter sp. VKM Ac-2880]
MTTVPVSTYRLQLTADFRLQDAADLVDYIRTLGADWVYLSPILRAEPGSTHGYDVVDHTTVDPERGGAEGLTALAEAAHAAGLGVLIDTVPNHMGVATPAENAWWWDLLQHGREAEHAAAFDVDWEAGAGRIRIPILGDVEGDHSALDDLTVEDGELRYFENRLPIAPGTADDGATPREVHDRQHYELVNWRRADAELNYRRFFAVNTLAAIRVEDPAVFDGSHVEIGRWFDEQLADGIRVDHPDGLLDPGAYLDRLSERIGGAPIWVEKILEGEEDLPAEWATLGTTGYDALGDVDRVLVDPAGLPALAQLAGVELTRDAWDELVHTTKRGIADGILGSEVRRLARLVPEVDEAVDALAEILTAFPVYRSYLPLGDEYLDAALETAETRRPELAEAFAALAPRLRNPADPLAARFQQTSGMVMAKGVEDTAFYRYTALTSLTEVGGDPAETDISVAEFHHRQARRQAEWPSSMTTLSTHDTKRSEDVRARIDALSEVADRWAEHAVALHTSNGFPDRQLEQLVWQAAVGAWPIERERLHAYVEKAAREAGDSTTWTAPDAAFEVALHAAVDGLYDSRRANAALLDAVADVEAAGWTNSLVAKAVQLTMPGVPDVYQGSELWDRSLVDPDNRRPVDYAERRELLAKLDDGWLPPVAADGAAKLLVTSRLLRLRRSHPERYTEYTALAAEGAAAEHVLAFSRGGVLTVATRLSLRLAERGGWKNTNVELPAGRYVEVLTGREITGGPVSVAALLEQYPVAVLTIADGDEHTEPTDDQSSATTTSGDEESPR